MKYLELAFIIILAMTFFLNLIKFMKTKNKLVLLYSLGNLAILLGVLILKYPLNSPNKLFPLALILLVLILFLVGCLLMQKSRFINFNDPIFKDRISSKEGKEFFSFRDYIKGISFLFLGSKKARFYRHYISAYSLFKLVQEKISKRNELIQKNAFKTFMRMKSITEEEAFNEIYVKSRRVKIERHLAGMRAIDPDSPLLDLLESNFYNRPKNSSLSETEISREITRFLGNILL